MHHSIPLYSYTQQLLFNNKHLNYYQKLYFPIMLCFQHIHTEYINVHTDRYHQQNKMPDPIKCTKVVNAVSTFINTNET